LRDLEDNELDLVRLQTLLAQIRARDVFGAQGREAAESLLSKCAEALERYAAYVLGLHMEAN
jgi:hypothetical protein